MTNTRYAPILSAFCLLIVMPIAATALEPIPDKLVVLTLDDSCKSHFTVARPLLKEYGFGATFFVTEGLTYSKNPQAYMTWDQIRTLHDDGFEIGNHLKDHMAVNEQNVPQLKGQLEWIDVRCVEHGIPKPVSFAWPACFLHRDALPVLDEHGLIWSRRCSFPEYPPGEQHAIAYNPAHDHPHLIPCAAIPGPDYLLKDFQASLETPGPGEIAVICFHGVPETEHPWVNTPRERFEEFMAYLRDNDYTVIAMRDLAKYIDPMQRPVDPWAIIEQRQQAAAAEN